MFKSRVLQLWQKQPSFKTEAFTLMLWVSPRFFQCLSSRSAGSWVWQHKSSPENTLNPFCCFSLCQAAMLSWEPHLLTQALTQLVSSLSNSVSQKLSSSCSLQKEELAGWHPNHTQCPTGDPEVRDVVLRRELSQDLEKPSELSLGEELEQWEQKRSLSQRR